MNQDLTAILESDDFKGLIRGIVSEELMRFVRNQEDRAREISLIERIIRIEESLVAQGKILDGLLREMNARFEAVDKRFEAMDKRFESMDKRFESLQREMNARFEAVDKRFEAMDKRFNTLLWGMGIGFSMIMGFMTILKLFA